MAEVCVQIDGRLVWATLQLATLSTEELVDELERRRPAPRFRTVPDAYSLILQLRRLGCPDEIVARLYEWESTKPLMAHDLERWNRWALGLGYFP